MTLYLQTDIGTYSNGNLDIVLEKLLWRTRDYSTTEPPTVCKCTYNSIPSKEILSFRAWEWGGGLSI